VRRAQRDSLAGNARYGFVGANGSKERHGHVG